MDAAAVVAPCVPGGVGAGIKAIRAADNVIGARKAVVNTVDGVKIGDKAIESRNFDGGFSTNSKTSKEVFGKAKDQNGIPRSQQPNRTIKPNTLEGNKAGLDSRNGKQNEYTNSK